ncbi:MAG: hypothetical protein IPM85_18485 [Chitinophagaceae bacterium]|nr:hypothetical protein [Chitinophagaceae bacterium]
MLSRLLCTRSSNSGKSYFIKNKSLAAGIYVWTKGTIGDHLGGIPKNETGWANFNTRLGTEELNAHTTNGTYRNN